MPRRAEVASFPSRSEFFDTKPEVTLAWLFLH